VSGFIKHKEFRAVDSVNLRVEKGEFFGLLGPNGAGKTTLIKMISTLTIPTSGTAKVAGYDIIKQERQVRNSIGLVGVGERIFYWRLTGMQNLLFFASLYNIPLKDAEARAEELLKMVGLYQFADTRYMNYSTGMQRKLAIVRALLTDAPILLLDEPSIGLDPISAKQVRDFLKNHVQAKMGKTILLTTHYMEEAEELCDRVAFMNRGRLAAVGTPRELKESMRTENAVVIELENGGPWVTEKLGLKGAWWNGVAGDPTGRGTLRVVVKSLEEVPDLIKALIDIGVKITQVKMEEPSLYDVFVKLAGTQIQMEGPVQRVGFGQRRERGRPRVGLRIVLEKLYSFVVIRGFYVWISYKTQVVFTVLGWLLPVFSYYFIGVMYKNAVAPSLAAYGGSYVSFMVVGVAFQGYVSSAFTTLSSRIRNEQLMGTLEYVLMSPTRLSSFLFYNAAWAFLLNSLNAGLILGVGVFLLGVSFSHADLAAAALALLLAILSNMGLGMASAGVIMVTKQGDPISFLFTAISNLLSGVFFPISVLPSWLRTVSYLLPLTWSLEAIRYALLDGYSIVRLSWYLEVLSIFTLITVPLGLLAFSIGFRVARKEGSISQYRWVRRDVFRYAEFRELGVALGLRER